ncbi:unnamed protein product [Absidia cylindrospora]
MLHQDFLNAIHQRHSSQPTVFAPIMENKPSVTFAPSGSIADRRRAAKQQALSNSTPSPPPPVHTNHLTSPAQPQSAKSAMAQAELLPIQPEQLNDYLSQPSTLVLDVRSFVQFSHARICQAINVSIPNTILKRPTFTMEKVYETTSEADRPRMKQWHSCKAVVFYDQSSMVAQEQSATSYLANKMIRAGFTGSLYYLQGGFDAFHSLYPDHCLLTPLSTSSTNGQSSNSLPFLRNKMPNGLKTPSLNLGSLPPATGPSMNIGPFTAPMAQFENQAFNPFFSNIRQNMELSDGPIKERFPIRLPDHCHTVLLDDPSHSLVIEMNSLDPMPRTVAGATLETNQQGKSIYKAPRWLQKTMVDYKTLEINTIYLAELYEKLERTEQRRLQNIMLFHSKDTTTDSLDYPLSIVAGIEMGALNRYTNIWPFEYSRVKIQNTPSGSTGYINASFIQYYQYSPDSSTSTTPSTATNSPDHSSTTSGSRSNNGSTSSSSSFSSTSSSTSSKEDTSSPLSSLSTSSYSSTSSANTKNTTTAQSPTSTQAQSTCQVNPSCLKMMKSQQWYQQPYRRYISTQGPLPSTFDDFWQVVWEQNSRVVVMLTKEEEMNKIKCHRYWPSEMNHAIQYGPTRLTLVAEMEHTVDASDWKEDIIYEREFTVEKDGYPDRRITQLHYTGWMDYGVPDNPLGTLQLVQLADQAQRRYESTANQDVIGPMVIHCSAGCGRSGAFCAIDTVLRRLTMSGANPQEQDEHLLQNTDALWDIISKFREQRLSMVQTLRQFVFCYEVVWWWFLGYGRQKSHDGMEF